MIPIGQIRKSRPVVEVRPITKEDLPRLMGPRDRSQSMPQKLKESHHTVARFLATGLDNSQVAALTGYSANRVGQLQAAPAMQELIAHYRAQVDASWLANTDAYYDLASRNMLKAERLVADRLEEAEDDPEAIALRDLLIIARDGADRFGYGKKQTNLNVNADFAALLEKAIARSGKTIEATPAGSSRHASDPRAGAGNHPSPSPQPLRRLQ